MPKTSRGRKAPHRTRNWVLVRGAWKKIVFFDGYGMRQMLPDLDIMLWRGDGSLVDSDFVPNDEIWIDACYAAEIDFQLKVYRIETMRRWWTKDANGRYPDYDKVMRPYLKKKLCLPPPVPPFVERSEWDAEHQLNIVYVRGEIVRQYFDPHFMFGGHDLVYGSYIDTQRTVWIDVRQDPREIKYTLLHELTERGLMEEGWTYNDAHERATEVELMARARKHLVWPVRREKRLVDKKIAPLALEPSSQEGDSTCGPRSLKMILDFLGRTYRGRPYSEKKLVDLCACGDEGTEHSDLIRGAKAAGASVFVKEHGTIDELRHFVLKERLPVLVGWWAGPERSMADVHADHDVDEGHFSVVMHVTKTHVWLADPWIIDPEDEDKGEGGIRRVPIRQFMRHSASSRPAWSWCDTDTPKYLPTERWYMVLNFEGKKFRIPGGANI